MRDSIGGVLVSRRGTAEGFTMNPRLIEPGFVVVCLDADLARPGKDENGEDEAQRP